MSGGQTACGRLPQRIVRVHRRPLELRATFEGALAARPSSSPMPTCGRRKPTRLPYDASIETPSISRAGKLQFDGVIGRAYSVIPSLSMLRNVAGRRLEGTKRRSLHPASPPLGTFTCANRLVLMFECRDVVRFELALGP